MGEPKRPAARPLLARQGSSNRYIGKCCEMPMAAERLTHRAKATPPRATMPCRDPGSSTDGLEEEEGGGGGGGRGRQAHKCCTRQFVCAADWRRALALARWASKEAALRVSTGVFLEMGAITYGEGLEVARKEHARLAKLQYDRR